MGKSSSPPPPDYRGAAEEEAQASQRNVTSQNYANRPTINTPWGSQTWQTAQQIDPATGRPVTAWTSNITLDPRQQAALDDQLAINSGRSEAARGLLSQATGSFARPIDQSSLPRGAESVDAYQLQPMGFRPGQIQTSLSSDPSKVRQTAQDAVWRLQQPQLKQRREGTEAQLANMGLARGSEAWNNEMRGVNDAEDRAMLAAIESGRGEAGQLFSQDLAAGNFANTAQAMGFGQGTTLQNMSDQRAQQELMAGIQAGTFNNMNRQQALTERLATRAQPLNELNALLSGGQVGMPQFPGFNSSGQAQTPGIMNATQMGYQGALDQSNFQQAQRNQNTQAGLSAAMIAAMMFSDARMKICIKQVGTTPAGIPLVRFRYKGLPNVHIGVLAQDVVKVFPEAVSLDASGFMKVDYSKVY